MPPDEIATVKDVTDEVRKLRDIQRESVDDEYMRGLYNGLELVLAVLEARNPEYLKEPICP